MPEILVQADFERAATALRCEVAAIRAVCEVEAPRGGFLSDGRVVILFERHWFHRLTKGQYSNLHPDISNPKPGGYLGFANEYTRFNRAFALDATAAMLSASWGKFQIMGFNHALCGFATVDAFVDAMKSGEGAQLDAFVAYVRHECLDDELREHRWTAFARRYNGVDYARNKYDTRLANAYAKYAKQEQAK